MPPAVWAVLLLVTFQLPTAPAIDLVPEKEGVYIWRGADGWERVYGAILDDRKTKGLERFIQTDGQLPLNLTVTFEGSNSPVQISERRPVFYVRGIPARDDTLIVQLESKQDSRQARTSSSLVGSSNREGFRLSDIRRIIPTPISKGLIKVTPQEDLKAGEYILVFGQIDKAFDFGIQTR